MKSAATMAKRVRPSKGLEPPAVAARRWDAAMEAVRGGLRTHKVECFFNSEGRLIIGGAAGRNGDHHPVLLDELDKAAAPWCRRAVKLFTVFRLDQLVIQLIAPDRREAAAATIAFADAEALRFAAVMQEFEKAQLRHLARRPDGLAPAVHSWILHGAGASISPEARRWRQDAAVWLAGVRHVELSLQLPTLSAHQRAAALGFARETPAAPALAS